MQWRAINGKKIELTGFSFWRDVVALPAMLGLGGHVVLNAFFPSDLANASEQDDAR
jgi:hypothetical protein